MCLRRQLAPRPDTTGSLVAVEPQWRARDIELLSRGHVAHQAFTIRFAEEKALSVVLPGSR